MCVMTLVWLKDTNTKNSTSVGFVMTCVAFVHILSLQDNPGEIYLGNTVGILCGFYIATKLVFEKVLWKLKDNCRRERVCLICVHKGAWIYNIRFIPLSSH